MVYINTSWRRLEILAEAGEEAGNLAEALGLFCTTGADFVVLVGEASLATGKMPQAESSTKALRLSTFRMDIIKFIGSVSNF